MEIYTRKKFNFLINSLIFSLIGIFIPGFTLVFIFLMQKLSDEAGLECSMFWKATWIMGWIGTLSLPYYFYHHFKSVKLKNLHLLKTHLLLFNFLFYISLQISFGSFMTNANTLCYVSDGENGLEFIFTAWLSLPIIMVFSYIFSQTSLIKNEVSKWQR